jgi:hypothetical protein
LAPTTPRYWRRSNVTLQQRWPSSDEELWLKDEEVVAEALIYFELLHLPHELKQFLLYQGLSAQTVATIKMMTIP